MRDASNIIVLGENGTIIEQGSFQSLDHNNNYVQKLLVDSQANDSYPKDAPEAHDDVKQDPFTSAAIHSEPEDDLLRKSGDLTLYKYYLKSVGWKDGLVILLLSICTQFCVSFPREYRANFAFLYQYTNALQSFG